LNIRCAGLPSVPNSDWFCSDCSDQAPQLRKQLAEAEKKRQQAEKRAAKVKKASEYERKQSVKAVQKALEKAHHQAEKRAVAGKEVH
jgi:HPt (histidine-containing phosphotransfer) domain-containing protein